MCEKNIIITTAINTYNNCYNNNNNKLKDIKPENLLFDSKEQNAKIKVADFGLSRILSLQPQFTTKFGNQKQQQ